MDIMSPHKKDMCPSLQRVGEHDDFIFYTSSTWTLHSLSPYYLLITESYFTRLQSCCQHDHRIFHLVIINTAEGTRPRFSRLLSYSSSPNTFFGKFVMNFTGPAPPSVLKRQGHHHNRCLGSLSPVHLDVEPHGGQALLGAEAVDQGLPVALSDLNLGLGVISLDGGGGSGGNGGWRGNIALKMEIMLIL